MNHVNQEVCMCNNYHGHDSLHDVTCRSQLDGTIRTYVRIFIDHLMTSLTSTLAVKHDDP